MTSDQTTKQKEILTSKTENLSREDLAIGWLRYETIRKLSPQKFAEIYQKNITEGTAFDELIDQESVKDHQTTTPTIPEVEQILCFHRGDVLQHAELPLAGVMLNPQDVLKALFQEDLAFFNERPPAEKDPSKKQLITYCVLKQGDKVLRYTRGSKSGEKRLAAKQSIGIGGHVNPIDQAGEIPTYETYLEAVRRELIEEVGINITTVPDPIALINDDTNEVGEVHLGVVHVIEITENQAESAEEAIQNLEPVSLETLKAEVENLETWSQLLVQKPGLF